MKYVLFSLMVCFFAADITAQTLTVNQLQENAQQYMQQGDYEKAVASLQKARQQAPLNMGLLTNLSFAYFLQRDFSKAIETGKVAIAMDDADQKAFQVLGLSYKSIASYKEANKMYKAALKKFPNGGVIYNEYGESLALDKNLKEAIIQWEKGIQQDPNYSGNYFNAVKDVSSIGFKKEKSSGKTIMLEYSSPNTNKPLHLGHIRNNLLGYSVAQILKANGH
ncbi:MAG: arginine--tRNA ligase, partial [Sphingobacteriia bacterium]